MKNLLKQLSAAATLLVLTISCSSDFTGLTPDESDCFKNSNMRLGYTTDELKELGSEFFSDDTRGTFEESPIIEPIATLNKTRSVSVGNDTIAYVLNYPESKKFIVVANDKRVSPVLAFSDENVFDQTNPVIQQEFLVHIPEFLSNITETRVGIGGGGDPTIGQLNPRYKNVIGPYITTTMYGEAPFNKYFDPKEGVFAGGLPLASGYILSQCKESLVYKGISYDFKSINEGLKSDENSTAWKNAADKMAKLIYDFTMEVKSKNQMYFSLCRIEVVNSPGNIFQANKQCIMQELKELGYSIPGIDNNSFDEMMAIDHLKAKYILYVAGEEGYHYIIDGYALTFPIQIVPPTIGEEIPPVEWDHYFHCKWGFKNINDGYYRMGRLNNYQGSTIQPTSYFRVHI